VCQAPLLDQLDQYRGKSENSPIGRLKCLIPLLQLRVHGKDNCAMVAAAEIVWDALRAVKPEVLHLREGDRTPTPIGNILLCDSQQRPKHPGLTVPI
jgi:hypothetical protein